MRSRSVCWTSGASGCPAAGAIASAVATTKNNPEDVGFIATDSTGGHRTSRIIGRAQPAYVWDERLVQAKPITWR
jgi:hypothetical protein